MNVRRLSLRRAFIALLVTSAFAAAAHAQAERGKPGWGYALADELMSPWCPGFALPDCSSALCSFITIREVCSKRAAVS